MKDRLACSALQASKMLLRFPAADPDLVGSEALRSRGQRRSARIRGACRLRATRAVPRLRRAPRRIRNAARPTTTGGGAMKVARSFLAVLCAAALTVPATALAASGPVYYVALGDSVAAIEDRYPQHLWASLRQETPTLQLVTLACPGETTSSMISGYPATPPPIPGGQHFGLPCQSYPHGSQLDEAVAFLSAHRPFVALVTIDIGAGDFADCLAVLNFSDDCLTSHQSEM